MPQYQYGDNGPNTLIGTWYDDYFWGYGGNDILIGDRGNDELIGEGGDDLFIGGLGADRLDGGTNDSDTAAYKDSAAAVTVDLRSSGPQQGGTAEGDILIAIENVTGSRFADTLIGNGFNNIFRGGEGADHIEGGSGQDRASYAYSAGAIDVDLTRTGPQIGGDAAGDTLVSIERLTGSAYADHLVGDAKNNHFSGGKGADVIDGGAGNDYVDYRGSTAVDIDLTRAVQHGGDAEGDRLTSIESVRGSTGNDHIVGDANANHLIGDAGNDDINGGAGNDQINGGTGHNILSGGAGDDVVTTNGDGLAQGGDGFDTLILTFEDRDPANSAGAYMSVAPDGTIVTNYFSTYPPLPNVTLTATGFERAEIHGTKGTDTLAGTSGYDVILGNGGNDSIRASAGGDFLDGGAGSDSVFVDYQPFFNGNVTVDIGAGTATGFAAFRNFESTSIYTGAGNDHILGGHITNVIGTGAGDDFVQVWGVRNVVDVSNGQGNDFDTVIAGDGRDSVLAGGRGDLDGGGGLEDDLTLRLFKTGNVTVDGLAGTSSTGVTFDNFEMLTVRRGTAGGDDTLRGTDGRDSLWGGKGNDVLEGRGGDDDLRGDAGDDRMTGGAGADQFVFSGGHDTITDYHHGEGDIIILTNQAFPGGLNLATDAVDTADGVLLSDGSGTNTLLLLGIAKADLSADDFGHL